jgi:VanZ family protein
MASPKLVGSLLDLAARHRWLPVLVCCIGIITVSSIPRLAANPLLFPCCDKVAHFIEYSVLGAALRYWSRKGRKALLAGGVGFAALDEFHQSFIPGRTASLWDFVADGCGLAAGFLLSRRFLRKVADD